MLAAIVRPVLRLSRTKKGSWLRSSPIRTTSAVSMACAVPAPPMAMPTSARASAGASLTPSPTMATAPYCSARDSMAASLRSGSSPARTSSTPTCRPIAAATAGWSPVNITVCRRPPSRRACTTSRLPARATSATPKRVHTSPSWRTRTGVLPPVESALASSHTSAGCGIWSSKYAWLATVTCTPPTDPSMPRPPNSVTHSAAGTATCRLAASANSARPMGWLDCASSAEA